MIYRKTAGVLSMLGMLVVACGSNDLSDICEKADECARKSGAAFSKSQCENDAKADKEKAETAGCKDQYSEFADCVTDIDLQCSDNLVTKVQAECGAKLNALQKCME